MKTAIALLLIAPTIAMAGWRFGTDSSMTAAQTDDGRNVLGIAFYRPSCTPGIFLVGPSPATAADSQHTIPVDVIFQIDRRQRWEMELQGGVSHPNVLFVGAPLKWDVVKQISHGQSLVLQFVVDAAPYQWDLTGSARAIKRAYDACVGTTATKPTAPPARKPVWVQHDLGEVHL